MKRSFRSFVDFGRHFLFKNIMENLKQIGLTEKDFETIFEALENLPNKNEAGNIMGMLLTSMLSKEDNKDEMERLREEREQEREKEKKILKEKVFLLQAKIIKLKNILLNNES